MSRRDVDDFDEPTAAPVAREDRSSTDEASAALAERERIPYDDHERRYGQNAPRRSELGRDER